MAKIASDKRMLVVVWAAIVALLAVLAFSSWNAYGVEEAKDSSSTSASVSTSATASTSTSATESSAASASESSSSADVKPQDAKAAEASDATAEEAAEDAEKDPLTAQVEEALAHNPVPDTMILRGTDGVLPDTGGSAFTFVTPIRFTDVPGDLYWIGNNLQLSRSRVGNDLMAAAFQMNFSDSTIKGDVRIAGQSVHLNDTVIAGNVDVGALEVTIDGNSAANGYYCGAGTISFEGAAKRFIAYGQSIYFDGIVDGDVTLSAQDIIIGPHAKISGLLDIRSGQNLETLDIPAGAQISRIDTNLDHPNTIDQITQIRAAIAPYFQIGSLLFIAVSFVLLGLAMLWGFGQKLGEANRLVRRYPLAVLVLGCIALMLAFVIIMLGTVLIFTIPLSLGVLFILIAALIFCVPFTGSSLALMMSRLRPGVCVVIGSILGAVLLFVPYVNTVVIAGSLVYFVGYIVNISMFGHDEQHDRSFHARQADEDAPRGKARGILPVAAVVAEAMSDFEEDGPAIDFDDDSALEEASGDAPVAFAPSDEAASADVAADEVKVEGVELIEIGDAEVPVAVGSSAAKPSDAEGGGEPIWSDDPTDANAES